VRLDFGFCMARDHGLWMALGMAGSAAWCFRGALVSVALVRGYHAAGCCGFGRSCLGEVIVHRVSMVLSMRGSRGQILLSVYRCLVLYKY